MKDDSTRQADTYLTISPDLQARLERAVETDLLGLIGDTGLGQSAYSPEAIAGQVVETVLRIATG
ncbi:hypothetical protein, partial [Erythrobacter sp. HI0019]|uniref:hypothetical protein n=1 Tax=Erythrobacter sp. HI0019 TaxID=1822222 RepID=UPI0012E8CC61